MKAKKQNSSQRPGSFVLLSAAVLIRIVGADLHTNCRVDGLGSRTCSSAWTWTQESQDRHFVFIQDHLGHAEINQQPTCLSLSLFSSKTYFLYGVSESSRAE